MRPARKQAMTDMRNSGLDTTVFTYEKTLLEITKTEQSQKLDLRHLNSDYQKKRYQK